MRFDVVTLFPELFAPHLRHGITRRAFEPRGDAPAPVEVALWSLRYFAEDAYRRVDDRPYGGGPGMVMLAEPLERALAAVRARRADAAPVVLFTPTGRRIDQPLVQALAAGPGAVLVRGRYEGVDQRFIDRHVELELSLGDFVLSRCSTRWRGCRAACSATRSRMRRTASPTGCSRARSTPGPRCCAAAATSSPCRRCCCRATMRTSRAGGASARSS